MMDFVSWDDDIPNLWKKKIHGSKPPIRSLFGQSLIHKPVIFTHPLGCPSGIPWLRGHSNGNDVASIPMFYRVVV